MWTRTDIERLYLDHGHMVFRRCRSLLGSDADARDALQEVFLRVLEHHKSFAGRSAESTWLYAVATNLCLQRARGRALRDGGWEDAVAERWSQLHPSSSPDAIAERRQLARRLFGAADPETATMAFLHFMEGVDQGQIAQMVGLSRVTVNQRLQSFRALAAQLASEERSHAASK